MRIAVNGNRRQEGHFQEIARLFTTLLSRGFDVVVAEPFLRMLTERLGDRFAFGLDYLPLSQAPNADLAISIGGDGAFLKTARWVAADRTPVAGINTGHLGYLSAFTFEKPDDIYDRLLHGDFSVETRAMIQVEIHGTTPDPMLPLVALNEVAITRGDISTMVTVRTRLDSHPGLAYKGDGLIIATPTGSTAYNLSVGGPILAPALDGWAISPIAAHSLSMRPLVVPASTRIDIDVESRGSGYRLAIDGKATTLPVAATLTLTRSPLSLRLVTTSDHCFTDTLRDKLGMGSLTL